MSNAIGFDVKRNRLRRQMKAASLADEGFLLNFLRAENLGRYKHLYARKQ